MSHELGVDIPRRKDGAWRVPYRCVGRESGNRVSPCAHSQQSTERFERRECLKGNESQPMIPYPIVKHPWNVEEGVATCRSSTI